MQGETGQLKETQVQQQISRCCGNLDNLECSIKDLENRLTGILASPSVDKEPEKPEQALVPLANNIRATADRINIAVNRINNLRNRIEL